MIILTLSLLFFKATFFLPNMVTSKSFKSLNGATLVHANKIRQFLHACFLFSTDFYITNFSEKIARQILSLLQKTVSKILIKKLNTFFYKIVQMTSEKNKKASQSKRRFKKSLKNYLSEK